MIQILNGIAELPLYTTNKQIIDVIKHRAFFQAYMVCPGWKERIAVFILATKILGYADVTKYSKLPVIVSLCKLSPAEKENVSKYFNDRNIPITDMDFSDYAESVMF